MTTANNKKSIKTAVVVTYVIATLLLVAGWFVPAFGYGQDMELGDTMLFWYVPAIINAFLNPYLGKDLITVSEHKLPEFAGFEREIIPGVDIQIPALMILVYLVITVLALVLLIPVCAAKKDKTSVKCAYSIEGSSLIALGILFLFSGLEHGLRATATSYLNLISVFAAVLVVLLIQAMVEKKSYGAAKVFLFLFTAVAAMCALFAIDNMCSAALELMKAEDAWDGLLDALHVQGGLYIADGTLYSGMTALESFIGGFIDGENTLWVAGNSVTANIVNVGVFALLIVMAINVLIDFFGLMTGSQYTKDGVLRTHRGEKVFGVVRYAITFIIALVVIICILVDETVALGICLCAVAGFVLINLIISIIRLALVPSQQAKAVKQAATIKTLDADGLTDDGEESIELVSNAPAAAPVPAYSAEPAAIAPVVAAPVTESAVEPAAEPVVPAEESAQLEIETIAPAAEEQPEEDEFVYTPKAVTYKGPTDAFLDTLSNEEKIEFCKVFVDKSKGNLPAKMPDYEIGGDNEDFFPAIFINLGRFRAMLSSGLLRKIYKYLNNK